MNRSGIFNNALSRKLSTVGPSQLKSYSSKKATSTQASVSETVGLEICLPTILCNGRRPASFITERSGTEVGTVI